MHNSGKEEVKSRDEPNDASPVDTPQEEFNHILERKNMTKREFNWLWAG